MAAQDDFNALVARVQAATAALKTDVTNIQAKLDAGAGAVVDTSALAPAVTDLESAQAAVDALAPAEAPVAPVADVPAAPVDPAAPQANVAGPNANGTLT